MDRKRRLHSIRVRITLLSLGGIALTAVLIGAVSVLAVRGEIGAGWWGLSTIIAVLTLLLLAGFGVIAYAAMGRVTDQMNRLTEAARRMVGGDYDVAPSIERDDEMGELTGAFRDLAVHLKGLIADLSGRVDRDALTGVRNKGGFDNYARKINAAIQSPGNEPAIAFAVVMFDCNELKEINDAFGHDKGDIYLQNACRLICDTFSHSPVFRLGGDEFAAILINEDYRRREERLTQFDCNAKAINAAGQNPWDRIDIARGMSEYRPGADPDIETVLKRADTLMYEEKRIYKAEHGLR